MESSTDRLTRLMSMNKMKLSRLEVIRIFLEKTGMTLTSEHFLGQDETATVRTRVYQMVKDCGKSQQLKNLGEVTGEVKKILEINQHLGGEKVILLHYRDTESGAITISFVEFSNLFEKIIDFLGEQDIVVLQIKGKFGFCFEAEEYGYLQTMWGF